VQETVLQRTFFSKILDSAVGIAIGCRLDDRNIGVQLLVDSDHFVQTDSGAYTASTGGYRGVKLTTHFQLVPRSIKLGLYIHFPILHEVLHN
jgi:hypothetical protein